MAKPIPELTAKDIARFWASVDVRGPDECWLWKGSRHGKGYGHFSIRPYRMMFKAQRVALTIDGRNPMEMHGLHRCDNPPCCNPAHLFTGTSADNVSDCIAKRRRNTPKGDASGSRTKPEKRPRGCAHGLSKLSDSDIRAIRADPRFHRDIAADYGVVHSTIGRIKRRHTWTHIP